MYANARSVFDHARSDLDQALTYRCELSLGQRTGLRDGGAHAMHQPEGRGVEDEPHLIGGRVMARHAVREELRLVQFDQVRRVGEEVTPPRPPQSRTSATDASGSSRVRFAPSGVAVNDPGRWQRVTGEERIEGVP